MSYNIGVIEDNLPYREFLHQELTLQKIEINLRFWKSAEEFLSEKSLASLDILLLDINLPHMSGIDLLEELQKRKIVIKVIILSVIASEETIFKALKAGAVAYASKLDKKNIMEVIQIVLKEGAYISPTIAFKMIHYLQEPLKNSREDIQLTPKELQILKLITNGETAGEISETLDVTEATIRFHIRNIYKKLQVKNRVELLKKSERKGLI
ncbi:MAG: response regulator [Leptospiraceae bacterium]|nr:response regulator [Leptospiraceae bacterium]